MRNLVPHFIIDNYKKSIYEGSFNAITMFIDISGFTSITEQLMKKGKEGAETLSNILNDLFDELISAVYDRGGFISGFAGDAFYAIFIDVDVPISACYSAITIKNIMKKNNLHNSYFGNFNISAKIGMSYGKVNWGIIGSKKHKTYFFRGKAINGCANSQKKCRKMEIIIDKELYRFILNIPEKKKIWKNYFKLKKVKKIEKNISKSPIIELHDEEAISNFFTGSILNIKQSGEFRDVVSVFISFIEPENFFKLNDFIIRIIQKVNIFGGYFSRLDFGDKGSNILIFFGAPISYEGNIIRAINFILSIKKEFGNLIRAGITYGIAYAGFIGSKQRCDYTCLGDVVNLSARFMMRTEFGKIWVSKEIYNKIQNTFELKNIGYKRFKGKSHIESVYELLSKKRNINAKIYDGEIIGRRKEFDIIKSYCNPIFNKKFAGVFYVYGEPGIGKSRLICEITQILKKEANTFVLQIDSILKNSLNPFIYCFNEHFRQYEASDNKDKKILFEKIFNKFISQLKSLPSKEQTNQIINELNRIKSVIAALIGIHWKGSLYEQLDAKGKYENTLFAIKDFFKAQSLIKPIIIVIEDLQWIDMDSKKAIEILTRNMEGYPIIIISTSRFTDEGEEPKLILDTQTPQKSITIEQLSMNDIFDLTITHLGKEPDPRLLSYICLKSEGNPFYIEQFCRFLKENNIIGLEKNTYKLLKANVEVPKDIRTILIARIDRLNAELKETVQLAAVLGREFDIIVLEELVNVVRQSIEQENVILKRKDISKLLIEGEHERIWNILSEIKYIFKHTLFQNAVYQMQLKSRLKKIHEVAGDCIEKIYQNNKNYYSDIAFHYEKASVLDKTIKYLEKAGDFAKNSYQNEQALKLYDKLLKYIDDKEKEIKILIKKGEVLQFIGKWKEVENIYKYNINKANELQNNILIAELNNKLGSLLQTEGNFAEALSLLDNAYKLYTDLNEKEGIFKSIGNIGIVYHRQSNYDKAMECYQEELKIAKELNNKKGISRAVGNIGIVYKDKNNYDKAMECYQEQLKISEELNDKLSIARAYANIGVAYYFQENKQKAIEHYQKQLDIATELGNKLHIGIASSNIGIIYYEQGNYNKAIEYYQKQLDISTELGNKVGIASSNGNMALIFFEQGKYDIALKHYQRSLNIFVEIKHKHGIMIFSENIGNLYKKLKDYDRARKYYNNTIDIAKELGFKVSLCQNIYNKADLYYSQKKFEKSKSLNSEALEIAKEINKQDTIFNCELLNTRIIAIQDKNNALTKLDNMLSIYENSKIEYDNEQLAELYYELFKLSNNIKYKVKSLNLYEGLYKDKPNILFKNRIEKLSN